ncbi:MAG: adenylate cyclase [Granulosicoccus sp.]
MIDLEVFDVYILPKWSRISVWGVMPRGKLNIARLMKHKKSSRIELPSLSAEQREAQHIALYGRIVALIAIAVLVTPLVPWPGPLYIYFVLLLFAFLGWGGWLAENAQRSKSWFQYGFVTADFALMSFVLLYPNPLLPLDYPPQFILRYGNFIFFFVLLAGLTYAYRPGLVLWGGLSAAACWTVGILWLLRLPDTVHLPSEGVSLESMLSAFADPMYIDLGIRVQEVGVLLIVAGLLALAVMRSRTVAIRQANLAREKANLARYFPDKTAELLAGKTNPFSQPREHDCAIIFADLVAFTTWSQQHTPAQTIALLREVHGILAKIIFKNNGTLDKFMGDGLMATFGTPEPTEIDASNALIASVDMVEAFEVWKQSNSLPDISELSLAIGGHYGNVVIGDIGSEERLEFAVLGDAVNVASRLESATRQMGCRCLISSDLMAAAEYTGAIDVSAQRLQFEPHPPISLRGRSGETSVFVLR